MRYRLSKLAYGVGGAIVASLFIAAMWGVLGFCAGIAVRAYRLIA